MTNINLKLNRHIKNTIVIFKENIGRYTANYFSGQLDKNRLTILNMNRRNLEYIYPNNAREFYPLADNKLNTKLLYADSNIPMADTYQVYSHFFELRQLESDLLAYQQFVIKPASGSGGGGILVIEKRVKNGFITVGGDYYSLQAIQKHIADILFGIYAFGLSDQAIVEEKIQQHNSINALSPQGLADVRIIINKDKVIQAMIRLATKNSKGTANLHQGAIGVGINIITGRSCNASLEGKFITQHPDTDVHLIDIKIPHWQKILATATQVAKRCPLKYIGADIALAQNGPVLLEINARPGIEIQNANGDGMRDLLEFNVMDSAVGNNNA